MPTCPHCRKTFVNQSALDADRRRRKTSRRREYQAAYRRGHYDGVRGNTRRDGQPDAYAVGYDAGVRRRVEAGGAS